MTFIFFREFLLTAFHDLQAKDKQRVMETVIEEKSQKKVEEEESGEDRRRE